MYLCRETKDRMQFLNVNSLKCFSKKRLSSLWYMYYTSTSLMEKIRSSVTFHFFHSFPFSSDVVTVNLLTMLLDSLNPESRPVNHWVTDASVGG